MDFSHSKKRSLRRPLTAFGLVFCFVLALVALATEPFVSLLSSTPPFADPSRLEADVRKLSVDFYPRSFDRPAQLERSAAYVSEQFRASGARVTIENVVVEGEVFKNVVARFGPADGSLLVVGAHYDSHGDAASAKASPASHTPGADDNASGVAGLLELARLLGRERQTRAIELVAYTLEEPPHFRTPHMGSVWHAKALRAAGRDVELMLALEMIGYFDDRPGSQAYPVSVMKTGYPDRGNFIALIGKFGDFGAARRIKAAMAGATDLPVYSLNAPAIVQGVDFSDHRSYWAEGFPAMMVTDTAFMRNPNYHRAGDTPEKLDYRRMAKVVQAVYAVTQAR
jgi:Zn-dependent M28 family amino/carboxypeptidase